MSKDFYSAVRDRRSMYGISKETVIPDERIIEIVRYAVMHAPSAMNSQSGRAVVLLGEQHDRLWDITTEILRKRVPAEKFAPTEAKMNSFRNGYGSIMFFEDQSVVEALQAKLPTYKDNFPMWSLQSSGMLQYIVWTALEAEGFGASLQHYNPLIDEEVRKEWSIPENWKLLSQMVFGKPTAPAGEKEFKPLDERVKVFGR
jgi:predicted oxidoreductase (fatty acid repression mutant protein)